MCTRYRNRDGASGPSHNMLWLYLHFPALQLDSLPPSPQPLAVVCEQRFQVLQLNSPAQAQGIRTGMGMALACSLSRELQVVPYRPAFTGERLRELAHSLYPLSADISVFEPDGLLLKAGPMLRYYTGLTPYWHAIQQQLQHERLRHFAATGLRPFTARAVARSEITHITDEQQPLTQQWQSLPLSAADLAPRAQHELARLGLKNLGQLTALPRSELAERIDAASLRYLQQLTGDQPHPVDFYIPPAHFQQYRELVCESDTTAALLPPLNLTLQSLEHFLRRRDQVTDQLQLTLHLRRDRLVNLEVYAGAGEDSAALWQGLIELKLESVSLEEPVYAYTLSAHRTFAREAVAGDLFGEHSAITPAQLLARLQAKLGRDAITQTALSNDVRPGHTLPADTAKRFALTPHSLRPSLLQSNPKATAEPLVLVHGPERIVTGWWDQQTLSRDYFVARNRAGRWLWVYRSLNPPDKNWHIHGYFS